jgi:hypothetical protein
LVIPSASRLMRDTGLWKVPMKMTVKRSVVRGEERLEYQTELLGNTDEDIIEDTYRPVTGNAFPRPFLPLFPNGWADLARREGFELPKGSQEK